MSWHENFQTLSAISRTICSNDRLSPLNINQWSTWLIFPFRWPFGPQFATKSNSKELSIFWFNVCSKSSINLSLLLSKLTHSYRAPILSITQPFLNQNQKQMLKRNRTKPFQWIGKKSRNNEMINLQKRVFNNWILFFVSWSWISVYLKKFVRLLFGSR